MRSAEVGLVDFIGDELVAYVGLVEQAGGIGLMLFFHNPNSLRKNEAV